MLEEIKHFGFWGMLVRAALLIYVAHYPAFFFRELGHYLGAWLSGARILGTALPGYGPAFTMTIAGTKLTFHLFLNPLGITNTDVAPLLHQVVFAMLVAGTVVNLTMGGFCLLAGLRFKSWLLLACALASSSLALTRVAPIDDKDGRISCTFACTTVHRVNI